MKISDFPNSINIQQLRQSFQQIYVKNNQENQKTNIENSDHMLNISNTSKLLNKVESFLNLNSANNLNIDDLPNEDKEEFLAMISSLMKEGIIGYEVLEIDGQPEKHFIVNQIGNDQIYDAKLYDETGEYV